MMFQLIKNRAEAGKMLMKKLLQYKDANNVIVFSVPRGGVPVAYEIAIGLNLPLDIIIVRKLGFPGHEEYAIGAITINNVSFINPEISEHISLKDIRIQAVIEQEQKELLRRNKVYRNNIPMPDLTGKKVILVDDGIATGASITAAVLALKSLNPKSIILAVPILPNDTLKKLEQLVEKVVFLHAPESFQSVSLWYEYFPQNNDDEVVSLYNKANQKFINGKLNV